jgi:hypothetical protein
MTIPLNCRSLDYLGMTKGRAALSFSFAAWEDEQQVPPMRYAPDFLAWYQGTTSVVPFPAKMGGALESA